MNWKHALLDNLRSYAALAALLEKHKQRRRDGVEQVYYTRSGDSGELNKLRESNIEYPFHGVLIGHQNNYTGDLRYSKGRAPQTPLTGDATAYLEHIIDAQEHGWMNNYLDTHVQNHGHEAKWGEVAATLHGTNSQLIEEHLSHLQKPRLKRLLARFEESRRTAGPSLKSQYAGVPTEMAVHAAILGLLNQNPTPDNEAVRLAGVRVQTFLGNSTSAPGLASVQVKMPEGYLGLGSHSGRGLFSALSVGTHTLDGHLGFTQPQPVTAYQGGATSGQYGVAMRGGQINLLKL